MTKVWISKNSRDTESLSMFRDAERTNYTDCVCANKGKFHQNATGWLLTVERNKLHPALDSLQMVFLVSAVNKKITEKRKYCLIL